MSPVKVLNEVASHTVFSCYVFPNVSYELEYTENRLRIFGKYLILTKIIL